MISGSSDIAGPLFQVYKAPSSRRSSVSMRVDRETTLNGTDHWVTPENARDSMRSVRSSRSNRTVPQLEGRLDSASRRSKRSNRGSTRSKGRPASNSNGSVRGSKPWEPRIAPSSGVDSDHALTPDTPNRLVPRLRGHENESFGNESLSETPYSDYMSGNITPGPPPGPAPPANRRGAYKPVSLSQSFNAVDDLPPPLDEGPEAYSRRNDEFPAPPSPLNDGPDPYLGRHAPAMELNNLSQSTAPPHALPSLRPSHINIDNAHQRLPPPPSTDGDNSEKSPVNSGLTSPSTPEKPLQPRLQLPDRSLPLTTYNLRAHAHAMQHPPAVTPATGGPLISSSGNTDVRPIGAANARPYSEYAQINIQPINARLASRGGGQLNGNPRVLPGVRQPLGSPQSNTTDVCNKTPLTGDSRIDSRPFNPNIAPAPVKDNTFRRMVTGNLTVAPQSQSNGAPKPSPDKGSVNALYSKPAKSGPELRPSHLSTAANSLGSPPKELSPRVYQDTALGSGARPVASTAVPSQEVKLKSDLPPWERSRPTNLSSRNQRADSSQNPRPPVNSASDNQLESRSPSDGLAPRPVGEVTSSYGGLYSSRASPGPRRRSQYGRERPTHETRPPPPQTFPSNSDYANHSTNVTDDVKTKGGPYVSSSALVV